MNSKKLLALILACVMALSLVACGKTEPAPTPAPEGEGETEVREYEWMKGVDEVTGTVVVYTPDTDVNQQALLSLTDEYYPNLEVEIVAGGMSELVSRLQAESAAPTCDVCWGAFAQGDGDAYYDLIEKYTSPVPGSDAVSDPNGYYNYYMSDLPVLIVNTELLNELGVEVKSYADLLQPELKGQIISADPTSSSSAWKQLIAMLTVNGGYGSDAAWDYVVELMGQLNGALSDSSSNCFKSVINGEYAVGLTYESGVTTQLINGAQGVEMVYPSDGTIQSCFAVSKVKDCPNPVAAEAVIDLLCSELYQNIVAETAGTRGTNSNSVPSSVADDTSAINILPCDLDDIAANQSAIQDKWSELWAEVN